MIDVITLMVVVVDQGKPEVVRVKLGVTTCSVTYLFVAK